MKTFILIALSLCAVVAIVNAIPADGDGAESGGNQKLVDALTQFIKDVLAAIEKLITAAGLPVDLKGIVGGLGV